jgi:hypothetical protein
MIFAEMTYDEHYSDFHHELLAWVQRQFSNVQSGLQGDSWIWISDGMERVALDTFTSMKHQIKSRKPGAHVQRVIDKLATRFEVTVYPQPVFEAHEEG